MVALYDPLPFAPLLPTPLSSLFLEHCFKDRVFFSTTSDHRVVLLLAQPYHRLLSLISLWFFQFNWFTDNIRTEKDRSWDKSVRKVFQIVTHPSACFFRIRTLIKNWHFIHPIIDELYLDNITEKVWKNNWTFYWGRSWIHYMLVILGIRIY
jgi:hypothetical protein